jgi:hypothetical protein
VRVLSHGEVAEADDAHRTGVMGSTAAVPGDITSRIRRVMGTSRGGGVLHRAD